MCFSQIKQTSSNMHFQFENRDTVKNSVKTRKQTFIVY